MYVGGAVGKKKKKTTFKTVCRFLIHNHNHKHKHKQSYKASKNMVVHNNNSNSSRSPSSCVSPRRKSARQETLRQPQRIMGRGLVGVSSSSSTRTNNNGKQFSSTMGVVVHIAESHGGEALHGNNGTDTAFTTSSANTKFNVRPPGKVVEYAHPSRPHSSTSSCPHSRSRSRVWSRRRGRSPTVKRNVSAKPLPCLIVDELLLTNSKKNSSIIIKASNKCRNNNPHEQWDNEPWTNNTAYYASAQSSSPTPAVMQTQLLIQDERISSDILLEQRDEDEDDQHPFKECKEKEEDDDDEDDNDVGDNDFDELRQYVQLFSYSYSYSSSSASSSSSPYYGEVEAPATELHTNYSSQQWIRHPQKKKILLEIKTMDAATRAAIIDEILNEADEEMSIRQQEVFKNRPEHQRHPIAVLADDPPEEDAQEVQNNHGIGKKGGKEEREQAFDEQDDDNREESEYLHYLMNVD
jgi:hypothetical protein